MIDICTVVFQEELDILRIQARSIERYGHDVGVIRVILNDDSVVDPTWWGKLANRFGSTWCDNGWVSQQVLKILGSAQGSNTWSMILDAKTLLTKQIDIFDSTGRPQVGSLSIQPVFEPSRQIINQLFDIDMQQQLGPGGVPFIINNAQARALIQDVQIMTNENFAEWFQSQGTLTEFMLYSGYLQYKNLTHSFYDTNTIVIFCCNVCHSEVAIWDRKYSRMEKATAVGVHRKAWSQLTDQQQQQYWDFLKSKDLL